jgi:hypothetical protein
LRVAAAFFAEALRLAALRLRVRAAFLAASPRLLSRLRTRSRIASLAERRSASAFWASASAFLAFFALAPSAIVLATFLRTPLARR